MDIVDQAAERHEKLIAAFGHSKRQQVNPETFATRKAIGETIRAISGVFTQVMTLDEYLGNRINNINNGE